MGRLHLVYEEIGLGTLLSSGGDIFRLISLRMLRLIGFGGTSVIIALYLKEIGFDERFIGLFMSATFAGDLIKSFIMSLLADRMGRKKVLVFGCFMMLLTGIGFMVSKNKVVLLIISTVGILTPTGGEVGPFRSVEQSCIASLVPKSHQSDIYAWYTFSGSFCAALGSYLWGLLFEFGTENMLYSPVESYKLTFLAYTLISFISLIISLQLSPNLELLDKLEEQHKSMTEDEESPLIEQPSEERENVTRNRFTKFLPEMPPKTISIVWKISLLFSLDAFASSLVPTSWQSFFFRNKFDIPPAALGKIFFTTGNVAAFTSLLATSLTKRIGPILTMVTTHLPSSTILLFLPFPSSLKLTFFLLILRSSTQSMDVSAKHVFLATVVPPEARTAVFGWVNVMKTLAQTVGPTVVGGLSEIGSQWITFVVAGALKVVYDLGVLAAFLAINRK